MLVFILDFFFFSQNQNPSLTETRCALIYFTSINVLPLNDLLKNRLNLLPSHYKFSDFHDSYIELNFLQNYTVPVEAYLSYIA